MTQVSYKVYSIGVHKKVTIFLKRFTLSAMGHAGCMCTTMGHGGGMLVLLNFETTLYFPK
jgi:hypothetical protein